MQEFSLKLMAFGCLSDTYRALPDVFLGGNDWLAVDYGPGVHHGEQLYR